MVDLAARNILMDDKKSDLIEWEGRG